MTRSVSPLPQHRGAGTSTNLVHVVIPVPYPITLPPGHEAAGMYYVVSHGCEVGIFADKYVNFTPEINYAHARY